MLKQNKPSSFDPYVLANEGLHYIYEGRRTALLLTLLNGLVVAGLLSFNLSWQWSLGWFAWLIVANAWHWHLGAPNPNYAAIGSIALLRRHVIAAGLVGAGWGSVALAFPWLGFTSQAAILLVLVVATSTAMLRLVLYMPLFVAFAIWLVLPICAVLPFVAPESQKLLVIVVLATMATSAISAIEVRAMLTRILVKQVSSEQVSWEDRLTGLRNRRCFDEMLEVALQQSARANKPLSLIILDVDHFKKYNDHYGHVAGDECLRRVAKALASCVKRGSDTLARYGGEEFTVILFQTALVDARHLAERLCVAVKAMDMPHEESSHGVVTISAGGVTLIPTGKMSAGQIVEFADAALYKAKEAGRNRVEWTFIETNDVSLQREGAVSS